MTKSTFFVEEDKILATLFDEGMDSLHLFKPAASPMYSERLLSLLPEEYYSHITVHDHFYLKDEYGLAGIHVDDPAAPVPAGYKGKVGRTCTDIGQLRATKKMTHQVFLRNIFNCIETPGEKSCFTIRQLEEAARAGLIDKRVYAMGGMTVETIRQARELGFGGVVVCGDLWRHFDIYSQQDFRAVIAHFQELRRAAD